MAKSSKDRDRRAVYEEMRKKQAAKERRSTLVFTAAAVAVAVAILAIPVKSYLDDRRRDNRDLSDIGVPAASAECQPVENKKVDLKIQPDGTYHVADGTDLEYPDGPPSFGLHWPNFLSGSEIRNIYSAGDRPPVERLVHSLEHGYTILWYDETIADDETAMSDLQGIADKYPVGDYLIIAPWEKDDGAAIPDNAHIALTHWRGKSEEGVSEYCGKVSGPVVQTFTDDYPKSDSPEPNAQ